MKNILLFRTIRSEEMGYVVDDIIKKYDSNIYITIITRQEYSEPMKTEFWESTSSEIAVFNKDGEFITITNYPDVVAGWLNTDKVAKVITVVQSATTKEEIETKLKALNI